MTLAEVLVTITILGLSITGMTAALGVGSTASAKHRDQVNADMVVRDYAESIKEWVRLGGYGSCAVGDNPVTGVKGTYNNTNVWNPSPEHADYSVSMGATSYQATQNYNVVLLLDKSSSIEREGAVGQVKNAAKAFIDGLADTHAYLSIVSFGTRAKIEPNDVVDPNLDTPPLAVTSPTNVATLKGYVDGIDFGQWWYPPPYDEYTNWEDSLLKGMELLDNLQSGPTTFVLVTDGDPTKWINALGNPAGNNDASEVTTSLQEAKGQSDALRGMGLQDVRCRRW